MRKVSVNLGEDDYLRAVNAHENGLDVELSGSLTQRGTRSNLRDLRDFVVLPAEEETAIPEQQELSYPPDSVDL